MTRSAAVDGTGARFDEHVETIVGSIGAKLRYIRKQQRLSLQQLATKADVSAATIHKIEHSDMVPTVTTLLKIASALDCPASYFIEDEQFAKPVAFTPASQRPGVYTPHRGMELRSISGPYAPFRCAAAVATVSPGAHSGTKLLLHPGEELVYVEEGLLTFVIAGESYAIGAGDSIHFLGDQAHRWSNDGTEPVRAVWFVLRNS